jgi:hypothetical protein
MIDEPTTILVIFIEMKPHRKLLLPEIKHMTSSHKATVLLPFLELHYSKYSYVSYIVVL